MNDYFTGGYTMSFEKAHIIAISDNGPRGDPDMPINERDKAENLMILCSSCHTKIDKDPPSYGVKLLKDIKKEKEERVKKCLDLAGGDECTIVRYTSAIGRVPHALDEKDIRRSLLRNGFYSKDGMIDLNESNDEENIKSSRKTIDRLFESRISRNITSGKSDPFCLFALGPQPLLIYLGWKFDDLIDVKVFIKRRDGWKYKEDNYTVRDFTIVEPKEQNVNNNVVLVLGVTNDADNKAIYDCFGEKIDVWKIRLSDNKTGIDLISNKIELDSFRRDVVSLLDKIGQKYGKDKEVSVVPIVPNALAVEFGRAYMKKGQNPLKIYDSKIEGGKYAYKYSLSIPPTDD